MAVKSISKTLVWILMGLLILGLGGFGVTNLSGTVRTVGSVGDTEININDYARALQNDIRALEAERNAPVSFSQAQQEGLDRIVLSRMIAIAALEDETHRMGISIGDANLREQIVEIDGFKGADGSFNRDAYRFALEQAGMSEAEFENDIRAETARGLLQGAIVAGVNTPKPYSDTLMTYLAERRNITWAVLDRDDLQTGLGVPLETDLETYHAENAAAFTLPEVKRITYAWLTPEMILDTVEVDEDALKEAYNERHEDYQQPERRLVERLGFADQEAAQAARARLDSNEATFETLVEERGLTLADVDMGDVRKIDLDSAGDAVFAAQTGDIIGPLDTPIGPALFRLNAVLQAQTTTYEEALPELRSELAADRARRVIDAQIDGVEDLLAGGATIEDLAAETEMQLGTIEWFDGMSDDIGAYEAFRAAAAEITQDDYPEVTQLEDSGIFAMRLDEVEPPALRPLAEVRDAVVAGWQLEATQTALREQLNAQAEQLNSGIDFAELGMTAQTATELTRRGFQPDMPPTLIETVFGMQIGGIELIEGGGRVFVLRLDDILPPDNSDAEMAQLRVVVQNQAAQSLAEDLYQLLADDIRKRAGIELNQQALNAVHTNFQ